MFGGGKAVSFSFELKAGKGKLVRGSIELGTSVQKKCAVRGTSDSGSTGENLRGLLRGLSSVANFECQPV